MSKKGGILGAHVSISGGVSKAPERGRSAECDSIQIFTKNANQWSGPPISDDERKKFKENLIIHKISAVIAHDTYLINMASPDDKLWEKSIDAFADELARTEFLDISCLVMHPGAHMNQGEKWGIKRIADGLKEALKRSKTKRVKIALETTAGQGSTIGYKFEQLAEIMSYLPKDRVGVCYDTAHTFAAGYDIRTKKAYEDTMDEFDKTIGLKMLLAIHLNDSKKELGSRVDRHERVGKGLIGLDGIMNIVADPRFENLPMVMEPPDFNDVASVIEDLKILRNALKKG